MKDKKIHITEELYLNKGAYSGKKRILKVEVDNKEIPFKQTDEFGRFEILDDV